MKQVSDQLEVAIVQGLEKHVLSFVNKGVVSFTPSTLEATLLRMKGEVERLFQDKYSVLDLVYQAIGLSKRNRFNHYKMSPLEMAKFEFIKEELKFSVAWTRQDILYTIEEYINNDKTLTFTQVNVLSLLTNEDNFGSNEEVLKFIDNHEKDILKDQTRHIYLTMNKETGTRDLHFYYYVPENYMKLENITRKLKYVFLNLIDRSQELDWKEIEGLLNTSNLELVRKIKGLA
ncbi:hypothetical protein ACQUY5_30850 [Bacillus cereus]|uniref:hypothetical protein n=1 Tax=Bacillus cereus TaxID=1396 RepID=UPI003D16E709